MTLLWLAGYMFTVGLISPDADKSFWWYVVAVFGWPMLLGKFLRESE